MITPYITELTSLVYKFEALAENHDFTCRIFETALEEQAIALRVSFNYNLPDKKPSAGYASLKICNEGDSTKVTLGLHSTLDDITELSMLQAVTALANLFYSIHDNYAAIEEECKTIFINYRLSKQPALTAK